MQSLSDDLLKYYQLITRAILGDDPHLMKVCSPAPPPPPPSLPVLMVAFLLCVLQVALLDLQSNSKMAALLPYFVYVISGVCPLAGWGTCCYSGWVGYVLWAQMCYERKQKYIIKG